MTDVPADLRPLVLRGHVVDRLRELPAGSVHCVVTSPPYWGLRDYSACACRIPGAKYGAGIMLGGENFRAPGAIPKPYVRDGFTLPRKNDVGTELRLAQPDPACPDCGGSGRLDMRRTWGGGLACITLSHEWADTPPRRDRYTDDAGGELQRNSGGASYDAQGGASCSRCGAWHGALGMEPTPELFVSHLADVFDEVRRVLRDDGTLWVDIGDTYATHPAGVTGEKRWAKSGIGPQDHAGHEQAGRFDKRAPGLKEKDLAGVPWLLAFELRRRGWYLRSDNVWAKPNPMPESVVDRPTRSHEYVFLLTPSARYFYDGDAVRTRMTEGSLKRYAEAVRNGDAFDPERHKHTPGVQSPMEVPSRAAAGVYERGTANLKSVWWIPTEQFAGAHFAVFPEELPRRCVLAGTSARGACRTCGAPWRRVVRAEGGTIGSEKSDWHSASKMGDALLTGRSGNLTGGPRGLPAKAGDGTYRRVTDGWEPSCPCGDPKTVPCVVLDPFAGSGTTLMVSRAIGRRSVGVELNPQYARIAEARCSAAVPDISSFGDPAPPSAGPPPTVTRPPRPPSVTLADFAEATSTPRGSQ